MCAQNGGSVNMTTNSITLATKMSERQHSKEVSYRKLLFHLCRCQLSSNHIEYIVPHVHTHYVYVTIEVCWRELLMQLLLHVEHGQLALAKLVCLTILTVSYQLQVCLITWPSCLGGFTKKRQYLQPLSCAC